MLLYIFVTVVLHSIFFCMTLVGVITQYFRTCLSQWILTFSQFTSYKVIMFLFIKSNSRQTWLLFRTYFFNLCVCALPSLSFNLLGWSRSNSKEKNQKGKVYFGIVSYFKGYGREKVRGSEWIGHIAKINTNLSIHTVSAP